VPRRRTLRRLEETGTRLEFFYFCFPVSEFSHTKVPVTLPVPTAIPAIEERGELFSKRRSAKLIWSTGPYFGTAEKSASRPRIMIDSVVGEIFGTCYPFGAEFPLERRMKGNCP
jgi:hypothetical protein